ncbi:MAG: MBL fold metallo-hydrolase [Acidimicrobiales bacterium]
MAKIRFYGGVGSIGSTSFLVEQDGWRALFDLGPRIPGRDALLRAPVRLPRGRELRARARLGEAPRIDHLYRKGAVEGLETGSDGRTAVFVSHGHIDHMGLLGWVDPAIAIHASEGTVRLIDALERSGQGLEGGPARLAALPAGVPVQVGPLSVERHPVDHDVPGASGYLVRCDDGVIAYTGDFRLHGRHGEQSEGFARVAAGAAALIVECTNLSGGPRTAPAPEAEVERAFELRLERTSGLVLLGVYPRDVDRVEAFIRIAAAHARQVLWPPATAAFLAAYGLHGIRALDDAADAEVRARPAGFVLQTEVASLGTLLDLPLAGAAYLHANGEPLGPFQPEWDLLQSWLRELDVPFVSIGTSGHASPGDLHDLVETVAPATVYPVHTANPYRLLPPPGTLRVLPEYGRWYRVGRGRARLASTVCVDLDSTLADTSHRHHLVLDGDERERTDWVAYSMACSEDTPIEGACRLVSLLSERHRIVVVSSRDEQARELTEAWLERHDIPFDEVILGGAEGVPEALDDFKIHHVRSLIGRGENVVLVIDDLPTLRDAAEQAGLEVPVLTVRPPYR